jgi:hypothetical protein
MTMVEDASMGSEEATETDIGRPGVCESPSCVRVCSACSHVLLPCPAGSRARGQERVCGTIESRELPCQAMKAAATDRCHQDGR